MQLDTKRTFDDLVTRSAGSDERRERILQNRFYQRMADTLAGTHEYMAMEKLYELVEEGDHEAIVIDTPPTRSALSFLDAPKRLTEFLGGRFLHWVLAPSAAAGRGTLKLTSFGAQAFARIVRRIAGAEVLADTAEFLSSFEGMYEGFKQRAGAVLELLRHDSTRFVIVTAPQATPLEEAAFFAERLREAEMPLGAIVANRCHAGSARLPARARRALERLPSTADGKALAALLQTRLAWQAIEDREAAALDGFRKSHLGIPLVTVPELTGEVHDLAGLRAMGASLFGGPLSGAGSRRSSRAG
jgi:anion-transporting  ArsA/GET3 family ATPase